MGTNYYLITKQKPNIPRKIFYKLSEGIHIGKSSFGWCFALHVYPEHGINNFDDWKNFVSHHENNVYNEDGVLIQNKNSFFYGTIDDRYYEGSTRNLLDYGYDSCYGHNTYEEFLDKNHAIEGPNNLLRSKIDNVHCIGHGEGTYDYMIGEFS